MFIFFALIAVSFIGWAIHFALIHQKSWGRAIELLLVYQLVWNVGGLCTLAFFGLTFMPDTVAAYNGWPQSPFQQEMANVNLAFATLGFLSIWFRDKFWLATVIGISIWLFTDGINHYLDFAINQNASLGNTGILLYSDLATPLILITLLILHYRLNVHRRVPANNGCGKQKGS